MRQNDFQFSIKQARDFIAVHRLKGRLIQINAVLRVNGIDNLVQLDAFEALKNLGEVQRNAEFLKHVNVGAGANHLAVDQYQMRGGF